MYKIRKLSYQYLINVRMNDILKYQSTAKEGDSLG